MKINRKFILLLLTSLMISCNKSSVGPKAPPVLKDVIKIAAGRAHNLALTADGIVWA